jgi:ferritin-like metal-binding protein YciE
MKTIDTLHELLKHELKDLYSAEAQIIEALPAMIEKASDKKLKSALKEHLDVTTKQKERLDKIQEMLGEENNTQQEEKNGFFANLFKSKEGEEHCKAMEGLIKEGKTLLKEDMTAEVMDAGIIAACQKIEHYEISSYGTAKAYAVQLRMNKVADLLDETLNEEYFADDSLTKLAVGGINLDAETAKHKTADSKGKAGDTKTKDNAKPSSKAPPRKAMIKKAAPKKAVQKKSTAKSSNKTKSATSKSK